MSDDRTERLYARAEQKTLAGKHATVRRGPVSLIAVCLGVALVVGVTAAVDLRRLNTPRGTALAWTGAAVFGDCTAFRELSSPATDDGRDEEQRCRDLRRATEEARDRPGDVDIELLSAEEAGPDRATAVLRVRLPGRDEERVPLSLRRRGGDWAVVLTPQTCAVLPCP